MAELRAGGALRRETVGKGADRVGALDVADDRAFERGIGGKAGDDGLDLAVVERRRVAHEQIVDRDPVFEVAEVTQIPYRRAALAADAGASGWAPTPTRSE